jgi:hypothetical protein
MISLGAGALMSVGNDTDYQLLIAASGCRTVTLFSAENPPKDSGAWAWDNDRHLVAYHDNLRHLSVSNVIKIIDGLLIDS